MTESPRTRVVLVTNSIIDDQLGGLQRYVTELSEALVKHGASVTVLARRLTADAPEVMQREGATILRRGYLSRANPLYVVLHPMTSASATFTTLRSLPPDVVVHGHFPIQAAPLIAMRGRPFVYTFHAPVHKEVLPEHRGRYPMPKVLRPAVVEAMRALESRVARRADRIAVLSEFMRAELLELAPEVSAGVELIPGGIDLDLFGPGSTAGNPWADAADGLLFTARRMVPRTGVRELVEAMPMVLERRPKARLAIAGSGPLRREIDDAVKRFGLDGSVRLLGTISQSELIDWYRRADLAVMPTQELEGFGLSAAEAMACETPVFATREGALPEVVGQLGQEYLSDGPKPAELATGLIRLLADPAAIQRAGAAARQLVERQYGWGRVAARYLDLYAAAAAAHRRA